MMLELPKFTTVSDLVEIPGCQLSFWGLYGLEQCEVPAVFAVGHWDDDFPVICCAGHVAQAITEKIEAIPSSVLFEAGVVRVWKLTGDFLADYNSAENQDSREDTIQNTRVEEGRNCQQRTLRAASAQSQRRFLPG